MLWITILHAAAAKSLQSCLTLCDPIDGSPSYSFIPGILQARILEWISISFSRRSPRHRDWTQVSHIVGRCFNIWATRIGGFNSDDHYIYYYGQESLRRNGIALIFNKSPKCSSWVQSQKWQNDLCSFPRQTIQYHGNPSLCPNQ